MNRFSLIFENPQLEAKYQSQNISLQTQLFSTFFFFQFCFLVFLMIVTASRDPGNIDHILIFPISAIFLLSLWTAAL